MNERASKLCTTVEEYPEGKEVKLHYNRFEWCALGSSDGWLAGWLAGWLVG